MSAINIENRPDVGYGYRWLEDNEIVIYGDEIYWNFPNSIGEFGKIITGFGIKVSKYISNETYETYREIKSHIRRKIDLGEGYRLIDPCNEILQTGDEFAIYHKENYNFKLWDSTNSIGDKIQNIWKENLNKIGLAYRRKISTITNMNVNMDDINNLAKCIGSLIKSSDNLTQNVNKLTERVDTLSKNGVDLDCAKKSGDICKDKKDETDNDFKVGDHVVRCANGLPPIEKGNIYQIMSLIRKDFFLKGITQSWAAKYFRKATKQEITDYLVSEATKQGFVVGAKVKHKATLSVRIIDRIEVIFPDKNADVGERSLDIIHASNKNEPFVAVYYGSNETTIPKLEIVKDVNEYISVTVDNADYIAQFLPGYVKFGCAEILNEQIRDSLKLITGICVSTIPHGNRCITAVQIGKGLFTKEILEKLVKQLKY